MSTWTSLKIELIPTGDQSGLWGVTTNNNFQFAIEEAITGSGNVTFASNNQTLILTNSNLTQTGRKLRLNLTGVTGGSTRTLFVPAIEKQYIINNSCADPILVTNGTDPTPTGTGVTIPAGRSVIVFNNGINITAAVNYAPSMSLGSALPVNSGGTGLTSFTGNGALFANAGGTSILSGTLPVASGGTGLTSFTGNGALFANAGGTSVLSGTLPVASGGTGATTYSPGLVKVSGTAAFTTAVAGVDYSLPPPATTHILAGNGTGGFTALPAPTTGFLQWTGSGYIWNTAIGSGSVTLVDASGGTTGMTFSGGPITTTGTLTLGGVLNVANGGTGQSSFTSNGALFANSAGTSIQSGTLPVASGGTGQASFNSNGALYANSAGTAVQSGTLPVVSGGTGNAVAPTNGQVLIGNGTGYTLATLTAGLGISISNAPGDITISALSVSPSTAKTYFMGQF